MKEGFEVITGAFGYSGRVMAGMLLEEGRELRTLTGHPQGEGIFAGRVKAMPFHFEEPEELRRSLEGARVVYNTYWVRFAYGKESHAQAVSNTKVLIEAAAEAGVERFVHVSITNPSLDSPLPYFRGKAQLEEALKGSGMSYAILRPAVLFGGGRDVLINNIAWLLRRFPVFGVPGKGDYGLQPIHVEDLARLAVREGKSRENVLLDAVGPESYSYEELVRLVARAIGRPARLLHLPRWAILLASRVLGWWLNDVLLTAEEVDGLCANLLVSNNEPTGEIPFSQWLDEHADELGQEYASELARHYKK